MSLRIIKRNPAGQDKEVLLEIDSVGESPSIRTYSVKGRISDEKDEPQIGKQVVAYNKGLSETDLKRLGNIGTTSSSGTYLIYYSTEELEGKLFADLQIKVFNAGEDVSTASPIAESALYIDALPNEEVNVNVSNEEFIGSSEYDQLSKDLAPYLPANFDVSTFTIQSIDILASKIEKPPVVVGDYLKAKDFHDTYYGSVPAITEEIIYGLLRFDLPYEHGGFLEVSEKDKEEALLAVTESNIINPSIADDIPSILAAFRNAELENGLIDDETQGPSFAAQLLAIAGITDQTKQKDFYSYFVNNDESEDLWVALVSDNKLTQAESDNAKLVFGLSLVTQGHLPLIQNLWDDASISSTEDLGNLEESDWLVKINTDGAGVPNVDSPYNSAEDIEYANALITTVEQLYPSKVLDKEIDADGGSDFTTTKALISSSGSYDIKDESPRKKFYDNGGAYSDSEKEEVYETRRLYHVFDKNNRLARIKHFKSQNLSSAARITQRSRRRFVKDQKAFLGNIDEAKKVYNKAYKRKAAALMLHSRYNPSLNSVNTRANIGTPIPIRRADIPSDKPELEVFFGSLDYCDCKHCRSSASPAAYLVDLLEFLKEAENSASGATKTAWEILKERRPDIPKIELTCDNTNTVMPYIDLVNEVLEKEINTSGNVSRQTSLTADELRVMPEHLDVSVYNTLSEEVYPWLLPFHLWNEEGNAYLKQLNINRSSITRAFKGSIGQTDGLSIEEACVYLGISSKMLNDVLLSTAFTQFYGGANSSTLASVRELLGRSGLTYQELLELIDTSFINAVSTKIIFNPVTSCDIDDATLAFTGGQYADLHRFRRLMSLMDWTVSELDIVLSALGAGNINQSVIIQLAGIDKLSKRFRLNPDILATWFGSISTNSYKNEKSQFEQIFLNPSYNSDSAVRANYEGVVNPLTPMPIEIVKGSGNLNQENAPVILAALRISTQDLIKLINAEIADGSAMSLNDLSHLYRVATFTRALKISIQQYLDYKAISSLVPISEISNVQDPNDTLAFLTWLDILNSQKFKSEDLRFLFINDSSSFPLASEKKLAETSDTIRKKLSSKLDEIGVSTNRSEEDLLNLFLFFFKEEDAVKSLEIVRKAPVDVESKNKANAFLSDKWQVITSDFEDDIDLIKSKLSSGDSGTLITDAAERMKYAFSALYPEIAKLLTFENEASQVIANEYDIPLANVVSLLTKLTNPTDATQKAIELFSMQDFIINTEPITLATHPDHINTLFALQKIILLQENLRFKNDQLELIIDSTSETGWFDVSRFPDLSGNNTTWNFESFINLVQAFGLEKKYRSSTFSLMALVTDALAASPTDIRSDLSQKLSAEIGWNKTDIDFLLNQPEIVSSQPDFLNEKWLVKLDSIFSLMEMISVSAEQLSSWKSFNGSTYVDITYEQAQAIRASVRSTYSAASWNKLAVEIRDKIRIKQRNALVAHIIANNPRFKSTDDLYSHFLIDTEMAPCSLTSRIKLATSTVQLWIQRIRMDLENGILFSDEDMDEWEWRKNYRVWEAARKVFMYPENWIEPELRDDKSHFFKELEDELLQDDVNQETVERAYLNYLKKMDEVANLEMSGTFQEEDRNVLHVFARTKNSPSTYFYRKLENEITWTDWEKIELDIEGNHLIPVVFNRRPMLFWPVFTEIPQKETSENLTYDPSSKKKIKGKEPETAVDIQLAYSEWTNNKWQPKKLSNTKLVTDFGFEPEFYFFKTKEKKEGLFIDVYYQDEKDQNASHVGEFFLNNCTGEIQVNTEVNTSLPNSFLISNTYRDFMKIRSSASQVFEITEKLKPPANTSLQITSNLRINKTKLLGRIPHQFKITYPVTESEILSNAPFFYEDGERVFFVKPSEKTYTKSLITKLPPRIIIDKVRKERLVPIPVMPKPKLPYRYIKPFYPQPTPIRITAGNRLDADLNFRDLRRGDLSRFY